MDFESFGKIPRLSRNIVVTEKIDGTNAQVCIYEGDEGLEIKAGSRNRWITPEDDNFGFARWVRDNEEELLTLGVGRHFGEWWGRGIQRGYGLDHKRLSLFNVGRWNLDNKPGCCHTVPVLYSGVMDEYFITYCLEGLRERGSAAADGFMDAEGVVIYHEAAKTYFKKTLKDDEKPKGK